MLELLITSSVLICVVLLVRLLFRGRISRRLQYALWLAVLLRLLIPVQFVSSPISVLNLLHLLPVSAASEIDTEAQPAGQTAARPVSVQLPSGAQQQTDPALPVQPEPSKVRPVNWFALVWAVGAVAVGAVFLVANLRFGRKLRKTRRRVQCDEPLPVYCAPGLASPCLFGLARPVVYLSELADGNELHRENAIRHELTHYRHYDHLWAIVRCVVLAAYWFDPFVWIAAKVSKEDCELACDEACVRGMTKRGQIDYGKTLVAIVAQGHGFSVMGSAATSMTNTNTTMKTRVQAVVRQRKHPLALALLALLLILAAAGCTFTSAAGENGDIAMRLYDMRAEDAQNYLGEIRVDQTDALADVNAMLDQLRAEDAPKDTDREITMLYGLQIVESAGETNLLMIGFDEEGRACGYSEEYGMDRTITTDAFEDAFLAAFGLEHVQAPEQTQGEADLWQEQPETQPEQPAIEATVLDPATGTLLALSAEDAQILREQLARVAVSDYSYDGHVPEPAYEIHLDGTVWHTDTWGYLYVNDKMGLLDSRAYVRVLDVLDGYITLQNAENQTVVEDWRAQLARTPKFTEAQMRTGERLYPGIPLDEALALLGETAVQSEVETGVTVSANNGTYSFYRAEDGVCYLTDCFLDEGYTGSFLGGLRIGDDWQTVYDTLVGGDAPELAGSWMELSAAGETTVTAELVAQQYYAIVVRTEHAVAHITLARVGQTVKSVELSYAV